jgi:pimeloyl-ACP methyl ester carboxylesterase
MSKRQKVISSNSIPRPILFIASTLQIVSTSLTVKFAKKLFTKPIKYKVPKREFDMNMNSKQELIHISAINKKIMTYHYGEFSKKVLLVHGWSGRGTQLVKIADRMLELGYSTISFDAPAHGKSPGNSTLMLEFIESILALEKLHGPFEYAIGHSLGSMSILNAIKNGLDVKKAVLIGSGDSVNDILLDFVSKLGLKPTIAIKMRESFEKDFDDSMESYSSYVAAKNIKTPILLIHDKNDDDVPYTASENIHENLENSSIFLTKKLGHRKILGDEKVINQIEKFLTN